MTTSSAPHKFDLKTDSLEKRDGQLFAERLGLDPTSLMHARGADGRDGIDAQAMNMALAPGTLGYMAGTLMSPVFEGWVDELTWFFAGYVSGRGAIPPIRIGAQPYGIVATTAFSRISWLTDQRGDIFRRLVLDRPAVGLLAEAARGPWRTGTQLAGPCGRREACRRRRRPARRPARHLGTAPRLRRVAHPRRQASRRDLLPRPPRALGRGPSAMALAAAQRQAAADMLRSFGYVGAAPDILDLFFRAGQIKLKGPIVEAPPLSETLPLAEATPDHRNYLAWLADAARTSLDMLRRQEGFTGDKPPNALLYIMLQFALTRGFQDAGDRLRAESGPTRPRLSPCCGASQGRCISCRRRR